MKGLGACAIDDIVVCRRACRCHRLSKSVPRTQRRDSTRRDSVYNETAHAAYVRDNTVRPEPPVTDLVGRGRREKESGLVGFPIRGGAGVWLSEIQQASRDRFDRDGAPTGSEPLWTSDVVLNWEQITNTDGQRALTVCTIGGLRAQR